MIETKFETPMYKTVFYLVSPVAVTLLSIIVGIALEALASKMHVTLPGLTVRLYYTTTGIVLPLIAMYLILRKRSVNDSRKEQVRSYCLTTIVIWIFVWAIGLNAGPQGGRGVGGHTRNCNLRCGVWASTPSSCSCP